MTAIQIPPDLVKGSLASGEGIICVGLPRTGSMSMAIALSMLGVRHVHHVIKYMSDDGQWQRLEKAISDHYPAEGCEPQPWNKAQWDPWLGHFQAVTDAAGVFAPELIRTYPNAKVILVNRDYDRWAKSMEDTLLTAIYGPFPVFAKYVLDPLVGKPNTTRGFQAMIGGWLEARTFKEAKLNCRRKYDTHHRLVREMVPPEQLLEYRMGDGWEPLARFLGVDVPKIPFPRANDTKAMIQLLQDDYIMKIKGAFANLLRMTLPLICLCAGYWFSKIGVFKARKQDIVAMFSQYIGSANEAGTRS